MNTPNGVNIDSDLNTCFHSIFGFGESSNSDTNSKNTENTYNIEYNSERRITINDLQKDNDDPYVHHGYRIEHVSNGKCSETVDFKIEQVFDKSLARERLKCAYCFFLTDNRGNLKQHMKIHQKAEKSVKFQCEWCDFQTKYRNSIKSHVLRHKTTIAKTKRRKKK